tara:strand:- start:57 stop:713 length:657 start_codon:yes stop_codon:yes gene_type:complete
MKYLFKFIIILFLTNSQVHSKTINECSELVDKIEKKYNIPNKLLKAISLTESGRTIEKEFIAWPWSLNVSGQSYYFNNKLNALSFLQKKIKNQKNIDIGCMQINFKYHNKNFKNLESMLDPKKNIDWAAQYIKELYRKYKSWNIAISRYHSSNPKRMKKYLEKVLNNWSIERQKRDIYVKNNLLIKKHESIEQLNKIYFEKNRKKILFFKKELRKKRL